MPLNQIKFIVDYFPGNTAELVVSTNRKDVCIYEVKSEVGSFLELHRDSVWMFGIYKGTLHEHGQLYTNHDDLFTNETENRFSFKRRPVHRYEELALITRDPKAFELFFWELKYHNDAKPFLPRPLKENAENTILQGKFVELAKSNSAVMRDIMKIPFQRRAFASPHLEIVEKMRSIPPSYFDYLFWMDNCIIYKKIRARKYLKKGMVITVVMDTHHLILWNNEKKKEIISWKWDQLGNIIAKKSQEESKPIIVIKVPRGSYTRRKNSVVLETPHNNYLLHMLTYMKEYYANNMKMPHYDYSSDDSLEYYAPTDEEDDENFVPLHIQLLQEVLQIPS